MPATVSKLSLVLLLLVAVGSFGFGIGRHGQHTHLVNISAEADDNRDVTAKCWGDYIEPNRVRTQSIPSMWAERLIDGSASSARLVVDISKCGGKPCSEIHVVPPEAR